MEATSHIQIEAKYFAPLGRIFTPIVLSSIAEKGHSPYLTEVCHNSGLIKYIDPEMRLSQFFDWIYSFLLKNYKTEYIYKNAITQKILLGKHSLNTSHLLTEFRVGRCKADAVVLNGTSTVYEIKSEYTQIVNEYYGYVPDVPNTQIFRECKKLFCEIPIEKAHIATINILKHRRQTKVLIDFIDNAPSSLSAYGLSICDNKSKMMALMPKLNKTMFSIFQAA